MKDSLISEESNNEELYKEDKLYKKFYDKSVLLGLKSCDLSNISKSKELKDYHFICNKCFNVFEILGVKTNKKINIKCSETCENNGEKDINIIFELLVKDKEISLNCENHWEEKCNYYCKKCKKNFCFKCFEKCKDHRKYIKFLIFDLKAIEMGNYIFSKISENKTDEMVSNLNDSNVIVIDTNEEDESFINRELNNINDFNMKAKKNSNAIKIEEKKNIINSNNIYK